MLTSPPSATPRSVCCASAPSDFRASSLFAIRAYPSGPPTRFAQKVFSMPMANRQSRNGKSRMRPIDLSSCRPKNCRLETCLRRRRRTRVQPHPGDWPRE
jgi:hypothetical protein